jgi:Spy/CpxP family protein refolding chaperone
MSAKLKSWLLLGLIFLAGALSGVGLSVALALHFEHVRMHEREGDMQKHIMAGLTRELGLSPDQQARIQPIVADASKQIQDVHHEEIGRVTRIISSASDQIAPLLTPEQKAKLDQLKSEGGAGMFFGRSRGWGAPGDMHHHGGDPGGEAPGPPPLPVPPPPPPPPPAPGPEPSSPNH